MAMPPTGVVIRPIRDEEVELFVASLLNVFGVDPASDPHAAPRTRALLDLGRTACAFDGDELVATAAAYTMTLTVPGGAQLPMAGLTMVTVRPTHRRQGILRRLLDAHFEECARRGDVLSGLWASEGSIYGRFGYGMAAESDDLHLAPGASLVGVSQSAGGPVELDALAQIDASLALELFPRVYDVVQRRRPGMFARDEVWWRHRRFADRPFEQRGRSPRRFVVSRRDGVPTGYVFYRQQLGFDEGRAGGSVDLDELVAIDGRAEATLWHYVSNLDLFPKVSYPNAPVDSAAPWLAVDRRSVVRRRRIDTLWLRLGDVGAALSARRYAGEGRLRLTVRGGPKTPAQGWELVVQQGVGRCERVDASSPAAFGLELGLDSLGSLYLGTVAPSLLARAGHLFGTPEAIALADRLFAWSEPPWCSELF